MKELIYKDLCYKITGLAFKIDNQIGFGQNEKVYCDALEKILIKENIPYQREVYAPIKIDNLLVAKRYFDFTIDDKIIVEIKTGNYSYKEVCSQLFRYIKQNNYKLGLVIRFNRSGVTIKRIPNLLE